MVRWRSASTAKETTAVEGQTAKDNGEPSRKTNLFSTRQPLATTDRGGPHVVLPTFPRTCAVHGDVSQDEDFKL